VLHIVNMTNKKEVLSKFPNAKIIKVVDHFEIQIPTLNDGSVVLGKGTNKLRAWKDANVNH